LVYKPEDGNHWFFNEAGEPKAQCDNYLKLKTKDGTSEAIDGSSEAPPSINISDIIET